MIAIVSAAVSAFVGAVPAGAAGAAGTAGTSGAVAGTYSYLVLTESAGVAGAALAASAVQRAGGAVVQSYGQVGVVVARGDAGLAAAVRGQPGVARVGATRTVPVRTPEPAERTAPADPGEAAQWNLALVRAYEAQRITEGSRDVVVAVADSGVDDRHPDLAPNFDAALSVDCSTGRPVQGNAAWRAPRSDHGTHVAGTIAAARNGTGVVGVAPKVRIAAVRIGDADAMFHGEASVCGFVWLAEHAAQGLRIANHSYYNDPWWLLCPEDEDQAVIHEAVRRAAAYAAGRGVLSIAAAGNENYDLAHKTVDPYSPNDAAATPATPRPVTDACRLLPAELPGVVTVAAVGADGTRASYSNTGLGVVDLAGPGGSGSAGDAGVLSTARDGGWATKQGTSMAAPAVAGVAALIASEHPDWGPDAIAARLYATATRLPCAAPCTAAGDVDSFHGHGLVDALRAVDPAASAGPDIIPCGGSGCGSR
ncbi:S8 family peptidase [Embleya sp. NBC_00896]|uniref:S8 family peptidase n=1 Tax=Embleya sp. NBC_00896 TaxID=2975961 RepID=UPI00386516F5|nr:S8 family serine peptidase [Embleya sp. NBC_00896]